jgi:acetolactate synthase-1/2/3 large subunit
LGSHRNPLSKRLLASADVVLGLGTRFEEMETNWRPGFVPAPDATYIQVDIDPAEIGRSVPAQLSVVGDIKLVAEDLLAAVQASGGALADFRTHPRLAEISRERAEVEAEIVAMAKSDARPIIPCA